METLIASLRGRNRMPRGSTGVPRLGMGEIPEQKTRAPWHSCREVLSGGDTAVKQVTVAMAGVKMG